MILQYSMVSNSFIPFIMKNSGMISIEQAMNIYHLLRGVIKCNIEGDVVEFGTNKGYSAALIQKTLRLYRSKKEFHVYDAFEGLPQKTPQDGDTKIPAGACKTTPERFAQTFNTWDLPQPTLHIKWFKDVTDNDLPEKICFAHLDGDFYTSMKESLELVYPRLVKGAIVVIDDYSDDKINIPMNKEYKQNAFANLSKAMMNREFVEKPNFLPGVKAACDEFFKDKPEKIDILFAGFAPHGYFEKQ